MGAKPVQSAYCRGVALILVLWFVVLLGVLAMGLSSFSRNSTVLARQLTGASQARYLAEGGMQMVLANLLMAPDETRLLGDGEMFDLPFRDNRVVASLWNESGKIDINGANEILLVRLFRAIELPLEQSEALAAAIIDWRDEDSFAHLKGAEDEDYLAAGLPYEASDSPFIALAELRKVLGMTQGIYTKIEPYITIYTKNSGVNPALASILVLKAISDDDVAVIEDYVALRRRNYFSGLPLPLPPNVSDELLEEEKSEIFTVRVLATTGRGFSAGQSMVFELMDDVGEMAIKMHDFQPYALITPHAQNEIRGEHSIQP